MQPDQHRCELCGEACTDRELGYACSHVAESPAITYVRSPGTGPTPDLLCTGCAALRDQPGITDADLDEALGLRLVCPPCGAEIERTRIAIAAADAARGYALGERRHYAALLGLDRWPHVPAVTPGGQAKLCFSRVPADGAPYAESMWIEVTHRADTALRGWLDNDPEVIDHLADRAPIEARVDHVVDARFPELLVRRKDRHVCDQCDAAARGRRDELDDTDRELLDHVRTYGWHVVAVPDDEVGPGYVFSVGLHHTFGHPEVVVFGLGTEMLYELINKVGAAVRDGFRFEPGHRHDGLLEGHPCIFQPVAPALCTEYLGTADWFYGAPYPALQLVWPDEQGRFPWEVGFDPALVNLQPALGEVSASAG